MTYRAVIIDDEPDSVESTKFILKEHCPAIEVCGTANTVEEATQVINKEAPDIVFLDIEMPDGNGFDVLERIPDRNFHVIFITAYNQYAIKAFKYSAVDYILKPIDIDDFVAAIDKVVKSSAPKDQVTEKIDVLLQNVKSNKPEKIALSTSEGVEFVVIKDIIQVLAEGSYSTIKMYDQSEMVVSKNLGEFENLLTDYLFYRPHQSHLINLYHVKRVTRHSNEIIMDDGSVAFLSRRKKHQFMELMAGMVQQKK